MMSSGRFRIGLISTVSILGFASLALAELASVEVLIDARAFKSDLPFDVPFLITGTAPKGVHRIELSYEDPGGYERFNWEPVDGEYRRVWARRDDETEFRFLVGPLKPNKPYAFQFATEIRLDALENKDEIKERIKREVSRIIVPAIAAGEVTPAQVTDIESAVKNALGDADASVDATTPISPGDVDRLLQTAANVESRKDGVLEFRRRVLDFFYDEDLQYGFGPTHVLASELKKTIEDKTVLSEASQARWESKLNPDAHEARTMHDAAGILVRALTEERNTLRDVVNGRAKFTATGIETSENVDIASLSMVLELINELSAATFQKRGVNQQFLEGSGIPLADINRLKENLETLIEREKNLAEAIMDFADVAGDVSIQRSYRIVAETKATTEGSNPYLSIDAGAGYAWKLDTAFAYTSATFYAKPVNTRADFSIYDWKGALLRRTGLVVGVTIAGLDNADIGTVTDRPGVLLGAGYRFARYGKLTVGVLFYNLESSNPIVDAQESRRSLYIAASIDGNLGAILKGLAGLF